MPSIRLGSKKLFAWAPKSYWSGLQRVKEHLRLASVVALSSSGACGAIKCRITNTRPIDVYNGIVKSEDLVQKQRKLKVTPPLRPIEPIPVFQDKKKKLRTKVRFLKKQAQKKSDKFYKQYVGQKRKNSSRVVQNWSIPTPIMKRRKWGITYKYLVAEKWRMHEELQIANEVELPKPAPKRKAKTKAAVKPPIQSTMRLRSGRVLGAVVTPLRRSSRLAAKRL